MTDLPLTGYCDPFHAEPGQRLRFMVSSPAAYDASLVRLIHGDDSAAAPGFKEMEVPSAFDGGYPGRLQRIHMGSCGVVESAPPLSVESFTVQAWLMPTVVAARPQAIVAKWSEEEKAGYAVVLENRGDLALWIGTGRDVGRVRTEVPLRVSDWHWIAASYDAASGLATLQQVPVGFWPHHPGLASAVATFEGVRPAATDAPLVLAAAGARAPFSHHLNGRIDRPRIFRRALDEAELRALREGVDPQEVAPDALVVAWDFSREMSSSRAVDAGPHGLHARLRNEPARALVGAGWQRREIDWRLAREEYSAIHFHEDDVGDAGWAADFELEVPQDLPSGVYAARLRLEDGTEDHIPFFVRAPVGQPHADLAVVFPTMTYLAYANDHSELWWVVEEDSPFLDLDEITFQIEGAPYFDPSDFVIHDHPELGCSSYDRFADGSGPLYSSYRRPILSMRPLWRWWATGAPRHLSADLYLVDWLHEKGIRHDILTDHDLHHEGDAVLRPYTTVVLVGHPEYSSEEMLDALESYIAQGGRVMYLGGNPMCWVTTVVPERPWVMEVRKALPAADGPPIGDSNVRGPFYGVQTWESVHTTGEVGGLWRFRDRSPRRLVGVDVSGTGWPQKVPGYRRLPASFEERANFIFDGVGSDEVIGEFGLLLGGAAGDEFDSADPERGTPPHALVVATSSGMHSVREGGPDPRKRADMTYFEGPNGGAVFSVGSITWCGSLSWNGYDNNVSRITENVLRRFLSDDVQSTGDERLGESGGSPAG